MDPTVRNNQVVWDGASHKHVREYAEHLEQARTEVLPDRELAVIADLLRRHPEVVHLQSGHGVDDHALVRAGARRVTGVDFSRVAVEAARRRAEELAAPIEYLVAELPPAPLADACCDLVYTGQGALPWMRDLRAWAQDAARLLRPGGHLFIDESHPAITLWTWDEDEPRIRPDRSYFEDHHVNDSFPADGAVEWQWTLGQTVNAIIGAGLIIRRLDEHPEPFWQPGDVQAAAWDGRLPNTFCLLAQKPA